jgi:hypothetical protein
MNMLRTNRRRTAALAALLTGWLALAGGASAQVAPAPTAALSTGTKTVLLAPVTGSLLLAADTLDLSGQARVRTIVVPDPDFRGPPVVHLAFDLSSIGIVGRKTRRNFQAANIVHRMRVLAATDTLEFSVPITTANALEVVGLGTVTLSLSFDEASGTMTAATVNVIASKL